MKSIWTKILGLIKGNKMTTFVIALVLVLLGIVYFQHQSIVKWKDKYQTEAKLKNALLDSINYYQNKQGEWVAEKLTIQETVKNLEKINGQLTDFQKELLARIVGIEKKNAVIAAALIRTEVKVDSLLHRGKTVVDTTNKTISFSDTSKIGTKIFAYDLVVGKALPAFPNVEPTLFIKSLYFPNKTFIEFHYRKERKADYPIAFSVTNTNGYFKTADVDSYIIPDVQYKGSKFEQWLAKNSKTLMYVGIGAGGMGALWLLSK
jgi:hypothetical protein